MPGLSLIPVVAVTVVVSTSGRPSQARQLMVVDPSWVRSVARSVHVRPRSYDTQSFAFGEVPAITMLLTNRSAETDPESSPVICVHVLPLVVLR